VSKDVLKSNPAVVKRLHRAIVRYMERQGLPEELVGSYR
jgi:hypothetical protein